MPTLLTINTNVPSRSKMGAPIFVFYDNGDWEVAFAGDLDYIQQTASSYVGSAFIVDVLNALNVEFEIDDIDEDAEEAFLFTSITIEEGMIDEPCIVLYDDGEYDIYGRGTTNSLLGEPKSGVFNFVPVVDFIEELREFVSKSRDQMFDWRGNDLTMGDEAEDL